MNNHFQRNAREHTEDEKMAIVRMLQASLQDDKPPYGMLGSIAAVFNVHRNTVANIWNAFQRGSIASKKTGNVGPRPKYSKDEIVAIIQDVPQSQRSKMPDVAEATGLSTTMVCRKLKSANKTERILYSLARIMQDDVHTGSVGEAGGAGSRDRSSTAVDHRQRRRRSRRFRIFTYVGLHPPKWFNADKDRRKVYLAPGEDLPRRACKSKRFIPKVMFLAAVARPWENFNGKIGMWPFVNQTPALRSSRNRPAGTLQTTLLNVSAEVYQDYVLNKVIPAIKSRFPSSNKMVVLQQDNASPHRSITNDVLRAVSTDGWTFVLGRQPPNSPDLNVLDLGFFASIQALQYKVVSRTVDDLIHATLLAFEMLCVKKLENVFLTLQAVMRLLLEHDVDNHFKLPHMNKEALR
ncbi:Aste57867_15015 [Aphanomyces stellatus]|uniref:Aste57867_15015 protein n=1 Tax=Aphanomyces stellatus TaxID=120398 RepID=A0A485L262_9STRA|nr:hypothetical protein As57867_014959 [Aphanomyces stellatus]VFT91829.1 Aste57867_15015 [Aphanomyces stellatus]